MVDTNNKTLNLRGVSRCYFTTTKRWWVWSWALRFVVFLVAIPAIWFPNLAFWSAIAVGVFSFLAELCVIITMNKKGYAEGILRKLDLKDAFGWEIEDAEVADLLVNLSKRDRARVEVNSLPDDYFASSSEQGWKRAMQNVQESSWWSKHLAKWMGWISFSLTMLLIVISIVALLLSANLFTNQQTIANASQVIISILLLVVSLGLISLTLDYFSFMKACERCETRATELLKSVSDEKEQSIKLFNEYHLARAASPLIPDWLWKFRKDHLNKSWNEMVQSRR